MDSSNIDVNKDDVVDFEDATSLEDLNLMSVREVARKLDCSENWIYEISKPDGPLKRIEFSPGKKFIAESDLLEYLREKRQ